MPLHLHGNSRDAMCDALVDRVDAGTTHAGGLVRIYSGSQPPSANNIASGTLLAEVELAAPAYSAASDGAATLLGTPLAATGLADGVAGWARVVDRDGETVFDVSVSASGGGGDVVLSDTDISVGRQVSLTGGSFTMPSGESSSLYRAVDTDFGTQGLQPQSWFNLLADLGYHGFITTAHVFWGGNPSNPSWTNTALERALNAGLWIGAYGRPVSLWEDAVTHIDPAIRSELKFFELDVEPEPVGVHPVEREYVDGVISYGLRPMIYSGWGLWGDVMGYGTGGFSDVPLWEFAGDVATVDYWPASMTEEPYFEFGGWNESPATWRVGWQIRMQDPPQVDGIFIDENLFDRAWVDAV